MLRRAARPHSAIPSTPNQGRRRAGDARKERAGALGLAAGPVRPPLPAAGPAWRHAPRHAASPHPTLRRSPPLPQRSSTAAPSRPPRAQVLFCQLTDEQRDAYERFLEGDLVSRVLSGRMTAFSALTSLLKICNHPHLHTWSPPSEGPADERGGARAGDAAAYGDWKLSGKLVVLKQVLSLWHASGDRALVFCQTRQMLDIVQAFVAPRYAYRRLDGTTAVGARLEVRGTPCLGPCLGCGPEPCLPRAS